jgi:hypothetical protein
MNHRYSTFNQPLQAVLRHQLRLAINASATPIPKLAETLGLDESVILAIRTASDGQLKRMKELDVSSDTLASWITELGWFIVVMASARNPYAKFKPSENAPSNNRFVPPVTPSRSQRTH